LWPKSAVLHSSNVRVLDGLVVLVSHSPHNVIPHQLARDSYCMLLDRSGCSVDQWGHQDVVHKTRALVGGASRPQCMSGLRGLFCVWVIEVVIQPSHDWPDTNQPYVGGLRQNS
jgi:hypothetical protein